MKALNFLLLSTLLLLAYQNRELFFNSNNENNSDTAKVPKKEKPILPPPVLPEFTIRTQERTAWQKLSDWLSLPSSYPNAKRLMHVAICEDTFVRVVRNAIKPHHSGMGNLGQLADLFDYIYQNKIIVKDPAGREYFASPLEYWTDHTGDCDDMAICMAVAANAIGIHSRIVLANGDSVGHAYAEICVGKGDVSRFQNYITERYNLLHTNQVRLYVDEIGFQWLNLDLNNPYPGGEYYDGERMHHYYPDEKRWFDFPINK
jgi:transglutaminase-like putative cysteine protease